MQTQTGLKSSSIHSTTGRMISIFTLVPPVFKAILVLLMTTMKTEVGTPSGTAP